MSVKPKGFNDLTKTNSRLVLLNCSPFDSRKGLNGVMSEGQKRFKARREEKLSSETNLSPTCIYTVYI